MGGVIGVIGVIVVDHTVPYATRHFVTDLPNHTVWYVHAFTKEW